MVDFPSIKIDMKSAFERTPRIMEASFGDGYSQPLPDGINAFEERWNLSFSNRPKADIDTLRTFLDAVGNHISFNWTAPDDVSAKKWVVKGPYRLSDREANTGSISCTLVRWFGP